MYATGVARALCRLHTHPQYILGHHAIAAAPKQTLNEMSKAALLIVLRNLIYRFCFKEGCAICVYLLQTTPASVRTKLMQLNCDLFNYIYID